RSVVPSRKFTVPPSTLPCGGFTVAVKVTNCPGATVGGEAVRVVIVEAGPGRAVANTPWEAPPPKVTWPAEAAGDACAPGPGRGVKGARPAGRRGTVPSSTPPSRKVTVPPSTLPVGCTVAVKVTAWPRARVVVDGTTVVVVPVRDVPPVSANSSVPWAPSL